MNRRRHNGEGRAASTTTTTTTTTTTALFHQSYPTDSQPYMIEYSDADAAAGLNPVHRFGMTKRQTSSGSTSTVTHTESSSPPSSLDLSEKDHRSENNQFFLLGTDISGLDRSTQFLVCAFGVFFFTLVYGYLQELIAVKMFHRKLGMFQAVVQFLGYSVWSFLFTRNGKPTAHGRRKTRGTNGGKSVPWELYVGISLLRAFDLSMTNTAMMFINYPAKTLIKSSRVVWTMGFGVLFSNKKYSSVDYFAVFLMVSGLVVFLCADASSSAVFKPVGVFMLIASLVSDGAVSNLSESVMTKYGVSQDVFIFKMYSLALVAITVAAGFKGDLTEGLRFLSLPGTMEEIETGSAPTWSIEGKISVMVVFFTFGFFGSSCSAAITKYYGAFTMSMTSTARKATTLFLSFLLFPNNKCTLEHVLGIVLFMISLSIKSFRAKNKGSKGKLLKQRTSDKDLLNGLAYIV